MPVAYPELTVTENLEIARRMQGIPDTSATSRVVERMGIASYADRKAGELSTGNLQRLGLARALLHEPELLILDEPANGLDPAGVVEIRELLASLAREKGVTVFMSSHILTEVDRLATRIGIIHKGRLLEELDAERLEKLRSRRLVVKTRNLETAQSILTQAGFAVKVKAGDNMIVLDEARAIDAPDEVATILVNAKTPPTKLSVEQEDLEAYFLRLTGERQ
jgi:ABC-2 type transport system ATP-binding protein